MNKVVKKKTALQLGDRAERIAAYWLRLKGWRIITRRYTAPGGEIDIIAQRGKLIAFIEVKARPTLDEALAAIDASKRRRMNRAVAQWLMGKDWAMKLSLRGDVICIAPWRLPRHVPGEVALTLW